jgi:predicted NBD/HSP70 family sugar kinase
VLAEAGQVLAAATGLPVILSNAAVAEAVGEVVASRRFIR